MKVQAVMYCVEHIRDSKVIMVGMEDTKENILFIDPMYVNVVVKI